MSRLPIFEDKTYEGQSEVLPGDYDNCTFVGCNLAGADLTARLFTDCSFIDCDLTNAKLHETARNSKRVAYGKPTLPEPIFRKHPSMTATLIEPSLSGRTCGRPISVPLAIIVSLLKRTG